MPAHGDGQHAQLDGDALEQYASFHWGREARKIFPRVHAHTTVRQDLVELGRLRQIVTRRGAGPVVAFQPPRPYPILAVGAQDGHLYIVRQELLARSGFWGPPGDRGLVLQTDYWTTKGSWLPEAAYWYHEHERPFAHLVVAQDGCATYRGGGYRVTEAGIVG